MPEHVSSEQDKFNISLKFSATNSEGNVISDSEVNWNSVGYVGLLMIERILIDALASTNDMGVARAEAANAKGIGEFVQYLKNK